MKFITKEVYFKQYLMTTYDAVRVSHYVNKKDEQIYERLYKNCCNRFLTNEKIADWYNNPVKELHAVEKYCNEPNISDEERKLRLAIKETYLFVNRERLESGIFFKFDKELSKRCFDARQKESIEIYNNLPIEILKKIADIRVFALGYTTAEVKQLLRPYCKKLQNEYYEIKNKAFNTTQNAEKFLSNTIDLDDFQEINIHGLVQKGKDLILETEHKNLLIKNGTIIEIGRAHV